MQVELDAQSQKYLVIDTIEGLMKFKHMHNGGKPASGIFQSFIENELNLFHTKLLK